MIEFFLTGFSQLPPVFSDPRWLFRCLFQYTVNIARINLTRFTFAIQSIYFSGASSIVYYICFPAIWKFTYFAAELVFIVKQYFREKGALFRGSEDHTWRDLFTCF